MALSGRCRAGTGVGAAGGRGGRGGAAGAGLEQPEGGAAGAGRDTRSFGKLLVTTVVLVLLPPSVADGSEGHYGDRAMFRRRRWKRTGLDQDISTERAATRITRMLSADNAKRAYQLGDQM
jgi:hypothetical protein